MATRDELIAALLGEDDPNKRLPLDTRRGGAPLGRPTGSTAAYDIGTGLAEHLKELVEKPGRAMREGITTGEAVPWATDVALGTAGISTPFAVRGALGSAGGRPGTALPMDEAARMARAREQGFTVDAYKGEYPYDWRTVPDRDWKGNVIRGTENRVPVELTEFDARKSGPVSADFSRQTEHAGFFSNDPAVASRFAIAKGEGSVFPVKLKFENPKIIDAKGAFAADFQFGPGAGRLKLPKDSPHDGVILKNTKDEGDVYIPKHSTQVRSRWATFDPANKESGNLLGGIAGGVGVGSLLRQDQ